MTDNFVHLHTHTDQSCFDGVCGPAEFATRAVEIGQDAIAFTEHGTVRGLMVSQAACDKAGVKCVSGCECYVVGDATRKGLTPVERAAIDGQHADKAERKKARKAADAARRERCHVTVWAMNDEGLVNLIRLQSWAWTDGFYGKPRVDLARLEQFGAGIIVSGGCLNGLLASRLRAGRMDEALATARRMADVFGDRFVVEIMPHVPPGTEGINGQLLRVADAVGAVVVATQDAHYPRPADADAQDALLCIQTRAKIADLDRFRFESAEYWLRTRAEMAAAFAVRAPEVPDWRVEQAMDATVALAARVTARVQRSALGQYLPSPPLPDGAPDHTTWLLDLVEVGAVRRFGRGLWDLDQPYVDRVIHELREIHGRELEPYFLTVWDLCRWSDEVGILRGPGRGSAAGSLVSYLLGITHLDPLRWGLSFERFLAPGRIDLPDVDVDFEHDRRAEVIDYLRARYGEDRVAQISLTQRLHGKSTLRDVGRVFGLRESEFAAVSALTEPKNGGDRTARTALTGTDAGRVLASRHPLFAQAVARLEGQVRTVGLHAAGVVVSAVPIADVAPVETRGAGKARVRVVAYDMHGVEDAGLVKFDVLGLKYLSAVRRACEASGITVDDIDPDDPCVYDAFTRVEMGGVFQFDTALARRLSRGIVFRGLPDVAVLTALGRPGPLESGLAEDYAVRVADKARAIPVCPAWDEAFRETLGVPVYQEQIVSFVRAFCGWDATRADVFRRKVSKKLGLADEETDFVRDAVLSGSNATLATGLFRRLEGFAQYCFNRAHAYSYALLAVWCQWLRLYHPAEWYAGCLTVEDKDTHRTALIAEARTRGVAVEPPSVQHPATEYVALEAARIAGPVTDLKGIGPKSSKAIADGAPFASLLDLYRRTAGCGRPVHAGVFRVLAQAGALREVAGRVPARLLAVNADVVWHALADGWTPEPEGYVGWDADEAEAAIVAVWPPHADAAAAIRATVALAGVRERITDLDLLTPSDLATAAPGVPVLVAARPSGYRTGDDDTGGRRARLTLIDAESAEEASVRLTGGLIDRAKSLAGADLVLALVTPSARWGPSCDGLWPVGPGGQLTAKIALSFYETPKAKPRFPARTVGRLQGQHTAKIEGVVVRAQIRRTKSGGDMLVAVLLAKRGFIRVVVWPSRLDKAVRREMRPGRAVCLRVYRAQGDEPVAAVADGDGAVTAWVRQA